MTKNILFKGVSNKLFSMTVEQKKVALISWTANLNDEVVLDQIVDFQNSSLDELPNAIVKLLKIAEAEPETNLVKHTSTKDILRMK